MLFRSVEPVFTDGRASMTRYGGPIDPAKKPRVLTLAARNDHVWQATLNGKELTRTDGFVNRWIVPAKQDGTIDVRLSRSTRSGWMLISLFSGLTVLMVLAPRRRNTYTDEWLAES